MLKNLLLLLCGVLLLLEPDMVLAATAPKVETAVETSAAGATAEAVADGIPRPNYKRYRGNSRTKRKRFWFFRKRAARRKARRQQKAVPARRGVIKVDPPTGTMPKP